MFKVHVCTSQQGMVCLSAKVTESIATEQETSGGGEYSSLEFFCTYMMHAAQYLSKPACVF